MKFSNTPLREEPRTRQATVIPFTQEDSLIQWLRSTGRLMPRRSDEEHYDKQEEDTEDLAEIMDDVKRYDFLEEKEGEELEL